MEDIVSVPISCLCGAANQTLRWPKSSLPLEVSVCHCDSCRYSSGSICVIWPLIPSEVSSLENLTLYKTSENHERYFCSTCGAQVCLHSPSNGEWEIAAGLLDSFENVVKIKCHMFLEDTHDGGSAAWLPETGGTRLPKFLGRSNHSQEIPEDHPEKKATELGSTNREHSLLAQCHCGGVSFNISPPDGTSTQLSSPWPDLIIASSSAHTENPKDVKWWLRANGTKYLAGTCTCTSCRKALGFPIQTWAFIPKSNIRKPDGSPLDFDLGTLKQYLTPTGKYREFCSRCGATVFWHCDERPDLIDVSVGVLRAKSGARAEQWLEWWTERVSFEEDALDRKLVEALADGLKAWRQKTKP